MTRHPKARSLTPRLFGGDRHMQFLRNWWPVVAAIAGAVAAVVAAKVGVRSSMIIAVTFGIGTVAGAFVSTILGAH